MIIKLKWTQSKIIFHFHEYLLERYTSKRIKKFEASLTKLSTLIGNREIKQSY